VIAVARHSQQLHLEQSNSGTSAISGTKGTSFCHCKL